MVINKITNANVLDLLNNNVYLATVELSEGRIREIREQNGVVTDNDALDLKGKWLSPGFIDTHSHLIMYSSFRKQMNCSPENVSSISDMIETFKEHKDAVTVDGWLRGYGYNEFELAEGRHPNRFDLDQISTDLPIYIQQSSAHMGAVNTKALEIMGVGLHDPDPKGGRYERDENGLVNGVLFEFPALDKVKAVLPQAKADVLAEDIEAGVKAYQAKGITNTTEMGVGIYSGMDDYEAVLQFLKTPQKIRTRWAIAYQLLLHEPKLQQVHATELQEKFETRSGGYSTLAGAKFFSDGSIQLHTAAIRGDYYDGEPSDDLQLEKEELEELFNHFQQLGYPLITHANGDKAAGTVIEAYKATSGTKTNSLMNRIEHLQTVNKADIAEMTKHAIGGSFFTNHIYYFGDIHKKFFLGPEKVQNLDPVRWAEDKGMTFTIHSDSPVTDISPLDSIRIAVERKTRQGELLGEHQQLTRLEAYKKMTVDAAILNGTDLEEGSINEGKFADFVVLEQNPLDASVALSDDLVEMTIVGGEVVYQK
ncbi:amidohydrolase [Oceanobacillus timonensis]|uniref:amidohydrolase n=1 Tax=Oceanobacillus timonensis TaxID=1926285 RepID=UPI0009BA39FE|nr:amidohydrolase [Oceanobacillus timonensis]